MPTNGNPDNGTPVTQPGGTSTQMSEGPLRSGIVPRKVTYPFKKDVHFVASLRTICRSPFREPKTHVNVRVRQKRVEPAGGHGVIAIFSKGR